MQAKLQLSILHIFIFSLSVFFRFFTFFPFNQFVLYVKLKRRTSGICFCTAKWQEQYGLRVFLIQEHIQSQIRLFNCGLQVYCQTTSGKLMKHKFSFEEFSLWCGVSGFIETVWYSTIRTLIQVIKFHFFKLWISKWYLLIKLILHCKIRIHLWQRGTSRMQLIFVVSTTFLLKSMNRFIWNNSNGETAKWNHYTDMQKH